MVFNSGYQEGGKSREGSNSDGGKQMSFRRCLNLMEELYHTLEGLGDH